MILAYFVVDLDGELIISEMLTSNENHPSMKDLVEDELLNHLQRVVATRRQWLWMEFEVMQLGNVIIRRYSSLGEPVRNLLVITDDREDSVTHLALTKMRDCFQSTSSDLLDILKKQLDEIMFACLMGEIGNVSDASAER